MLDAHNIILEVDIYTCFAKYVYVVHYDLSQYMPPLILLYSGSCSIGPKVYVCVCMCVCVSARIHVVCVCVGGGGLNLIHRISPLVPFEGNNIAES